MEDKTKLVKLPLKCDYELGVMAPTFNLSTQKADAGRSLCVRGQSPLLGKFQDSQVV